MKKYSLGITIFILLASCNLNAQNLAVAQRWIKAGNSLREAHQYEQSENYLSKGFKAVAQLNNRYWKAVAAEYLGLLYTSTDDMAAAKQYFNIALHIYKEQNLLLSLMALKSIMNDKDIATDNEAAWQYYGGIDIGSRGVKYSIIKVRRKGEHFSFVYLRDGSKNTQIIDFTPNALQETSDAVKDYLDTISRFNNGIQYENIFIAVSSGVKQEADKAAGRENALRTALSIKVPNYTKKIEFLDPCTEGDLTIKGVVPANYLYTSCMVDLGSGNTKGGYRIKNSKMAECFSIPWGTATLSKRLSRMPKENTQHFFADSVNNSIVTEVAKKPGLTNRRYAFFAGGICWSMCNYLYPSKIKEDFTEFTLQDVNTFLNTATANYETLIKPDLSSITNLNDLAEVQKQIERSRATFTQDDIIAGALLVKSILTEMQRTGVSDKHFIFSRYAYVGWISGYIVKKLDDDFKKVNE